MKFTFFFTYITLVAKTTRQYFNSRLTALFLQTFITSLVLLVPITSTDIILSRPVCYTFLIICFITLLFSGLTGDDAWNSKSGLSSCGSSLLSNRSGGLPS